ncbi:MAG TPA: hydrogenase maturation protease [Nevskiaceae bacterium]|nr:hydrogenase maturation protease [Nevskiaceae bacterium]
MSKRVLVAGIGNLFLGDDGFGCAVARALASRPQRDGVHVRDFGTRGVDLAYEISAGWGAVIFVDAAQRGGAPGTLYVLDPDALAKAPTVDGHAIRLHQVLPVARELGAMPSQLRLVACEPQSLEGPDAGVGLSDAVAAAIEPAVALVESLVERCPA